MYKNEYERWLAFDLDDPDLKPELESVKDDDEAIKDRFAVSLKFGTAGLRGVIGAGTNRMNVYVVRQATQGLANWVKTQGGTQTVAISYDSRIKSDVFAKAAAEVLAANGVKVRIYKALMPVPALSFATRYYNCNAGIMVTASHNPAKYNGYKAYGPDGCQMTDEAADVVYAEIQKTDVLSGAKTMSFEEGMAAGLIEYVGEDCYEALYQAIESRSVRPGLCKTAGLKLVYSPLNGSGLVPVTRVLGDIGITDITIVPEQKDPDGNFPTCPYPNPEIFEALRLGLELAEKSGADLMLATDPDADRVGIAVRCKDGSYELLSGNEVGVLLLDYICKARIENGTMPKDPVMVKSIVSTPLADVVAAHYGVECRNVLTGFKWIGDQIARLEAAGQVERFIFGFEESYGYLAGSYVRDKDAVIGSMLICEMAAYYRSIGSSIKEELDRIYAEYGRYLNKVDSYEFPGLSGMDKMAGIMQKLRQEPPTEFAGYKVVTVSDYQARTRTELATGKTEAIDLPAANVLIYALEGGATVVVRPSGTEPKIKTYFTTLGKNVEEAQAQKDALAAALKPILA
ncbi:phosphoglucomutase [Gemmiger sp. An87]|uniref:phospho-sugar mutase n=1 Tax=unclassified Allofournierella TaxID=2633662 RepID=UPI000B38496C|nr:MULTISPECIES: phospho-sugar mutase [unclassified Fournierella]OUN17049.1 phosphoglucomutase [Gemmiger sp. An87]